MMKRFVPNEYRSLLEYISPTAFKVVDWKKAMAQFLELSKHVLDKSYIQKIAGYNAKLFPSRVLVKNRDTPDLAGEENLTDVQFSETILGIYFSQLFSDQGALLDLRLEHFRVKGGYVVFDPGPFVHIFAPEFRTGMLEIYQGYYQNDSSKLENGMLAVGLVKRTDPEEIEETKKSLFSHFGEADQGPIDFNPDHFKKSFHELFLHLKKKKNRLSADFLFLGIYLVTLYLALSKIGQPVDVKKCFLESLRRNAR